MKSEEAREFVKTMEKDYNAHNKMINSTVAHQAIQMAEMELTQKAIEAFKFATDGYFIIGGTDYSGNRLNEFIDKLNS